MAAPRGAMGMRGRGMPMGRGRPPPQSLMAPPGYYGDPNGQPMQPPPAGYRPRGRGGPPPPLSHHPHSHPGPYGHHPEAPGGYPDLDSGEDVTPESGSPPESEITHLPPQGPPGGYPPFQPQARAFHDGILAENQHLRHENMQLKQQVADLAQGNELARPGWPDSSEQVREANMHIDRQNTDIFNMQQQMTDMFTAHQTELVALKEKLKEAEAKVKEATDKHESDVSKMKADIDDLTGYVSVAKADEGVVDDNWFKEELGKFAQSLRNWVWKHCRAATLMPDALEDPGIQARIKMAVPEFARLTMSNSKITVMQAVVNDMIIKRIFNRYCVGLTYEDELALRNMESMMTSHAAGVGPPNYNVINRWRALSISLLTNVEPVRELAEGNIVDCSSEIESIVWSLIPTNKAKPGEVASRALLPLLANAVRISHHLKSQRARFDTLSPVGHVFDPEWMEDASGMEDDADEELRGKMVGACAFPAVIKWGNEKGEAYNERTVIYRARVLCLLEGD